MFNFYLSFLCAAVRPSLSLALTPVLAARAAALARSTSRWLPRDIRGESAGERESWTEEQEKKNEKKGRVISSSASSAASASASVQRPAELFFFFFRQAHLKNSPQVALLLTSREVSPSTAFLPVLCSSCSLFVQLKVASRFASEQTPRTLGF